MGLSALLAKIFSRQLKLRPPTQPILSHCLLPLATAIPRAIKRWIFKSYQINRFKFIAAPVAAALPFQPAVLKLITDKLMVIMPKSMKDNQTGKPEPHHKRKV